MCLIFGKFLLITWDIPSMYFEDIQTHSSLYPTTSLSILSTFPLNLKFFLLFFSYLDIELNRLYTDSLRSVVCCNVLSVYQESHDEKEFFLSQKLANNNNSSTRGVILYLPSPSVLGFWVSNALLILQLFKPWIITSPGIVHIKVRELQQICIYSLHFIFLSGIISFIIFLLLL